MIYTFIVERQADKAKLTFSKEGTPWRQDEILAIINLSSAQRWCANQLVLESQMNKEIERAMAQIGSIDNSKARFLGRFSSELDVGENVHDA